MSQLSANPVLMASFTARSLRTGKVPGMPVQTGHVCVLGRPPNSVEQPQNSFESVESWTCTSSPITIVTLGLFVFVINAAMLYLVASLLTGFVIDGWWSAFLGWVVVGLTSWVASSFIGPRGQIEILEVRR